MSIGFDLQEDDAKFFEFANSADDGSPGVDRPSKKYPDVPNEFRVSVLRNLPRIISPQLSSKKVAVMTKLLKVRRKWPCLCH